MRVCTQPRVGRAGRVPPGGDRRLVVVLSEPAGRELRQFLVLRLMARPLRAHQTDQHRQDLPPRDARIGRVARLVDLRRGGQAVADSTVRQALWHEKRNIAAIARLAGLLTDHALVIRDIWLLKLQTLLARAHGKEASYRNYRDRYRAMATSLGFEGHMTWAEAMP